MQHPSSAKDFAEDAEPSWALVNITLYAHATPFLGNALE